MFCPEVARDIESGVQNTLQGIRKSLIVPCGPAWGVLVMRCNDAPLDIGFRSAASVLARFLSAKLRALVPPVANGCKGCQGAEGWCAFLQLQCTALARTREYTLTQSSAKCCLTLGVAFLGQTRNWNSCEILERCKKSNLRRQIQQVFVPRGDD